MHADTELDALSALAPLFRVTPELQSLCRFGMAWASPHAQEPAGWAPFHMVTAGSCVIEVRGRPPAALQAGDLALLPHGTPHVMRGRSPRPAAPIQLRETPAITVKFNTDQPETELICGRLAFEQAHGNMARAALPDLLVLRTADGGSTARLHTLLVAIRDELDAAQPGARAVCADLASALMVMALRLHFRQQTEQNGLLRLLTKRQTARAVTAMLENPARAWSLDDLAAVAKTSRATLVRDFRRLADAAPLGFLAEIRLGLARHSLSTSDKPLADVAFEVGYQSPNAFTRAFQRQFGMAPTDCRQTRAVTAPS